MLVVDSSVWIANLRGLDTPAVHKLMQAGLTSDLLVGDIVLLEVLQSAVDAQHALRIERMLRAFDVVPMLDPDIAVKAAANYRRLRSLGITIRKTPDLIIGTYCIEHGHALLHDDHDFEPMRVHLGLQVV
jgi:predicted nucleic acid-binding protein